MHNSFFFPIKCFWRLRKSIELEEKRKKKKRKRVQEDEKKGCKTDSRAKMEDLLSFSQPEIRTDLLARPYLAMGCL